MTSPQHPRPLASAGALQKSSSTPAKVLVASVAVLALGVGGFLVLGTSVGLLLTVLGIVLLVTALTLGAKEGKRPIVASTPTPIAYTHAGQPIYPVVGYTSDGRPVTADHVAGPLPAPSDPRTNSNAIAALILGFVLGPLAIPVGHIARAQIRRTGEQGAGLALVGLILGYLSVLAILFVVLQLTSIVA
jgi:hypothetical protein